jgi:hypothetical protein
MSAFDSVRHALAINGDDVTFRRVTGTQRVPFDVVCRVRLTQSTTPSARSAGLDLAGSVQQLYTEVFVTSAEMTAARWPQPPRHGDQVIFDDSTTLTVQGRAQITRIGDDSVYQIVAIG